MTKEYSPRRPVWQTERRAGNRTAAPGLLADAYGENLRRRFEVVNVILDLLSPSIEIGLVTTNLTEMIDFYEVFLGLELQGEIEFADGSQRRYALGSSVLKLVTYHAAPPLPASPGGGRAQAGLRYFTIGVQNLRDVAAKVQAAGYPVTEPPTEFEPVPGMGWMFIADPDGNSIELFGTL